MQCPTCHQAVLPEYYFCPNCGTKLHEAPLAVDVATQLKLYAHSIILPFLAFISVSKWQGVKYLKSDNASAKQIGIIATALLVFSTIATYWYVLSFTQRLTQSLQGGMPTDLGY